MRKDRYGKDDQAGEGWLGRVGELAGMAALAVAAPGFGEAADVALEGTIEAGEEAEAATAADEAGDHGAQEAAEGKLNKLRAARQKALMRPTSVRSAMQAGREDTYLKTGELRSSYDPRNLLMTSVTLLGEELPLVCHCEEPDCICASGRQLGTPRCSL